MAGVGNIYRSEALFAARVYPFTRVADLSHDDLTRVVRAAVALLRSSVHRGLARHGGNRVYLRTGQPCRRCGTPIRRAETADLPRATFWCPRCQPAPGEATSRS
jgi:endonuclease-8